MLKTLIILLLVFCVLSLYIKNIKKYFNYIKKLICINVVLIISVTINIVSGYSSTLINSTYLACKYDNQLAEYASYAQDAMRDYGVYASLILAQIIIESGFGAHQSSFGVKIPGVRCPEESSVCASKGGKCMSTKEEVGGKMVSTQACFEVSSSGIGDTIYNHGKFLTQKFGNRNELKNAGSLADQLKSLKSNPSAQYATSSTYLCSLIDQINSCDLTKYDTGISGGNISGTHLGTLSKENCNAGEVGTADPQNPFDEIVEKDHFATAYGGNIKEGWLYLRTKAYEDANDKYYSGPDDMDDVIDEIFYRARLTYTNNSLAFGNIGDDDEGDTEELTGTNEELCADMQTINAGGVNTWRQGGKPWSKITIGSSSTDTLSKWGCFATSLAIQIKRSGVNTGIDNFNPGTFVCEMLKHGGFDSSANIYAGKISFIPGVSSTLNESISATQGNTTNLINRLSQLMDQGHYPILWVNGSGSSGHYVAVTDVTSDNVNIIDPSGRGTQLWPTYTKVSAIRSVQVK